MYLTGYKAQVVKTEEGFSVVWANENAVAQDVWSLRPLFEMALQVINIAIQNSTPEHPFYWNNGRKKWSIDQVNTILEHLGVVNFLETLGDNTGGATYKYAVDMLLSYREYLSTGQPGSFSYQVDSLMDWCIGYLPHFYFHLIPPLQEAGEEGLYHLQKNHEGEYNEWWEDFN